MSKLNLLALVSALTASPASTEPPAGSTPQVRQIFGGLNLLQEGLKAAEPDVLAWLQAHVDEHLPSALTPVADRIEAAALDTGVEVAEGYAGPSVAAIEEAVHTRFGQATLDKLDQLLAAVEKGAAAPDAAPLTLSDLEGALQGHVSGPLSDKLDDVLEAVGKVALAPPPASVDPLLEQADAAAGDAAAEAKSVGAKTK